MFDEVLSYLKADQGGTFLDCTLGGAGHTEGILKANTSNHVFAADRDDRALERAKVRLSPFGSRFELKHLKFVLEISNDREGVQFNGMLRYSVSQLIR